MAELAKEELILECTKIITPHMVDWLKEHYAPNDRPLIEKCVSAATMMAEEIQKAIKLLPDKKT